MEYLPSLYVFAEAITFALLFFHKKQISAVISIFALIIMIVFLIFGGEHRRKIRSVPVVLFNIVLWLVIVGFLVISSL